MHPALAAPGPQDSYRVTGHFRTDVSWSQESVFSSAWFFEQGRQGVGVQMSKMRPQPPRAGVWWEEINQEVAECRPAGASR